MKVEIWPIMLPSTARRIKAGLSALAVSCFLMAGIVSIPGCTTVPNPLQQTANDERALYVAEAAYNGVLLTVNKLVDDGVIVPRSPEALRLADQLDTAMSALTLAKRAYEAGNGSNGYIQAMQALTIIADIQEAINAHR